MKKTFYFCFFIGIFCFNLLIAAAKSPSLDDGFIAPPVVTKPHCYWYWLNGDVTCEGITKDIESMAAVCISSAMIGNIFGGGPIKMFSEEWYALTRHAFSEAITDGYSAFDVQWTGLESVWWSLGVAGSIHAPCGLE